MKLCCFVCRVITPVRVVKVIPPSEVSPRAHSRSPLKSPSPSSPTKQQSSQSLLSKSKHTSPPGLYPLHSATIPAGSTSPPKLVSSHSHSPPVHHLSSPTKVNSNSHIAGPLPSSPHHPQSPLKSPHRLPVISKMAKSPPPLLPLNHVKGSPVHLSEDPLTVKSKATSNEHPSQHKQNGLPESSHKASSAGETLVAATPGSGKNSDVKFRTPKTPSTPLSSEIELDPNDYRYIVEYVGSPDNKVMVKPSQIVRGRGVLTPKKMKIFLRNALHRISEKHPFTVKVCTCTCICTLHTLCVLDCK